MRWIQLSKLPNGIAFDKDYPKSIDWCIREGAVWFEGRNKLRGADPASFEFLEDECTFLARDANHVFHGWSKVKAIDVNTFEALGDRYYRDKELAYLEHETSIKPLKGHDVENFAVLGHGYARDSVHGYYWGTAIRQCVHPLTLTIPKSKVSVEGYALDDQHVYFEGSALKDVDLATWQMLPLGFSRDATNVYHLQAKLPRVRIESWQHLQGVYSKDEKSVYFMNRKLKDADPDTFKVLKNGTSADKHGKFDEYGHRK